MPDKPILFWGTGAIAVQQALRQAADDAAKRRQGESPLPPPYPTAENPFGWRVRHDPLDGPDAAAAARRPPRAAPASTMAVEA